MCVCDSVGAEVYIHVLPVGKGVTCTLYRIHVHYTEYYYCIDKHIHYKERD